MPYQPDTLAVHAGQVPDPATNARAVPIYQTTTYVFNDTQHAADLFGLQEFGNIYTRIMNPTTDVFEKRMAELEGGVGGARARQRAGGDDAERAQPGARRRQDRLLHRPLRRHLQPLRVHASPSSASRPASSTSDDLDSFRAAIDDEHPAALRRDHRQPPLDVPDFEALAAIAHETASRSSWTTPSAPPTLCARSSTAPTSWSTRPPSGSAGTAPRSAASSSTPGSFDWASDSAQGFPAVHVARPGVPRPLLHRGLRPGRAHHQGCGSSCCATSAPALSPFNSFLFLQGLETLPLRMQRHSENALAVAEWLAKDRRVEWVSYPGLETHPEHANAAQVSHRRIRRRADLRREGRSRRGRAR